MRARGAGRLAVILSLAAIVGLGGLLLLLTRQPAQQQALVIHCGSSLRPAIEEIGAAFEHDTHIKLNFNFGGSETLLPFIATARKGDIFVCHDPFAEQLRQKDLLEETAVTGQLVPVIIVAKGNPLGIKALADLARPNVRVGLMDPRHAACGEITQNRLRELGIEEAVRKNVKVEQRSHADLAAALKMGHLDAAVVWNFIAAENRETLDSITTDDPYPQTNVTICRLKCAANPEGAREFLKAASSEAGLKIFAKRGYVAKP